MSEFKEQLLNIRNKAIELACNKEWTANDVDDVSIDDDGLVVKFSSYIGCGEYEYHSVHISFDEIINNDNKND